MVQVRLESKLAPPLSYGGREQTALLASLTATHLAGAALAPAPWPLVVALGPAAVELDELLTA